MKTEPNKHKGLVRDSLDLIEHGWTTEQIFRKREWKLESFYSERDKVVKYKVRDGAGYFVTGNHTSERAAIEAALYDPYRN